MEDIGQYRKKETVRQGGKERHREANWKRRERDGEGVRAKLEKRNKTKWKGGRAGQK